jgi:hypothetical protein
LAWGSEEADDAEGGVDQDRLVGFAGFQQADLCGAVGGKAVGQDRSGGAGADDDVVEIGHSSFPQGFLVAVFGRLDRVVRLVSLFRREDCAGHERETAG